MNKFPFTVVGASPVRITDPEFRYYPSHQTDIRRTFRRIRKEREEQQALERATVAVQQIALVQKAKA